MLARRAFGIDISYAQQTFSPPPAGQNDLDFVILKASQANFADARFEEFYAAALEVPIRGAYHYFITSGVTTGEVRIIRPKNNHKGNKNNQKGNKPVLEKVEIPGFTWQEQADVFTRQVQDKDFHFFVLDLEINAGTDPRTGKRITNQYARSDVQNIRLWVDEVKRRTGKPVLLYTRATVFGPHIQRNGGEILNDIDLWIARYPDDPSKGMDGDPYEGDSSVKIPGVSSWRFWQYSDRNNGKGAQYGVKTASVDLDVFNGTVEELRAWLGIEAMAAADPREDVKIVSKPEIRIATERSVAEVMAQLEALKQAGLNPVVRLQLHHEAADLKAFEALLAKLQEAGVIPHVHFNFGSGGEARAVSGSGGGQASLGEEFARQEKPSGEEARQIPVPEKEESFTVVVRSRSGKRTALQTFRQKDGSGKPIMGPLDTLGLGDRITRSEGDRLRVSAKHKISRFDAGDGRVRGADSRYYYYIIDDPANADAAGLYVLEPDVQRA